MSTKHRAPLEHAELATSSLYPKVEAAVPQGWAFALILMTPGADDGLIHIRHNLTPESVPALARRMVEAFEKGAVRP